MTIEEAAEALKVRAAAILDAMPDPFPNAPARQFVHAGLVVDDVTPGSDDCAQLAVAWRRSYTGTAAGEVAQDLRGQGQHLGTVAVFEVRLTVCAPGIQEGGNPPSAAELDAAGKQIAAQGAALLKGLRAAVIGGDLFEGCSSCVVGPAEAIGPAGYTGGVTLGVRVQF